MDYHYHRHERLLIRIAVILGVIVGILAFTITRKISGRSEQVSPEEVWAYVQEIAPQKDLDPEFIYAIAWAESSLNARARSSVARGMMQLTKPAWREVSDESYRHAWDWRTNVRVGIDYLAFCRDYLKRHDHFSYPLLAASYRYGPYHVRNKNFNILKLKQPKNEIYRRIFEGNIHPVTPPAEAEPAL
ncbi:lytic transglycosylase domain-containing protein [Coraliomargarita algicola]|uniref:Lytic transglycosylase domain-containing protein n=1 Tax=Coraliomargarita algicola TaxID=3092156 RepID=A0ABZ0RSW8_9BACT|nr:lytic transglycosylase domain-containing protein [Coraliomargarita sp. J2-16]WPJ96064.1 lytic transglycosylase domain-containing protein [Coraliomargarita sp. J2-16]